MPSSSPAPSGETTSRASTVQPISAGILAAITGFASSFTILLAGFTAVGASQAEAASGLFAVAFGMGLLTFLLSLRARIPITIAWSTPGAALLAATALPTGGYAAAIGAYLVTAGLIVVAGLWRPFGRAVASIPMPLAGAMLAGVLLELCLAPMRAVGAMPALALPIILAWALAMRFARAWAMPVAVVVTAAIVVAATPIPAGALADPWPQPLLVLPVFTLDAAIGIGLPLFLVTMASQNLPGLAVMQANGYRVDVAPVFVSTGLASGATALLGGHSLNLAAITAALCAGPEAHPDPARRWIASVANGIACMVLAFGASFATAFIAVSPPLLIQAVAGLALLGSLGGALTSALGEERDRLPALVTFVTAASGVSFGGIGAAFWGLIAGGALLLLLRWRVSA
ncbi:benzoate/H(+) symporter BenE family transporter [Desertibaculum subflavum]|uniref:benzoate/H(+) symporter BenE family transporter n=1 Tax=Desertibaculum subflavum TaxID=2268458 RepID=UPI000E663383